MKRFKMLALAAIAAATFGALGFTPGKAEKRLQAWGYYEAAPRICMQGQVDWGWTCARSGFGQVCTIQGRPAYENQIVCQTMPSSFNYMRRPF